MNVRWADCDPMGHANNAKYFTYMEQARVSLFKDLFGLETGKPVNPEHFPFIIAEISCRFLKPLFVDQELLVFARIGEVKNSSFIIDYELKDNSNASLVATGRSVQVWYDYRIRSSISIPDDFRKKLIE